MKNYWEGNQSLPKTFWLAWIAGSLLIAVILASLVYVAGALLRFPSASMAITTFIILVLFNPYYLFCWVANWRASTKSQNIPVKIIVRALVVSHAGYVFYTLLTLNHVLENGI
jgi:hypothetical protein